MDTPTLSWHLVKVDVFTDRLEEDQAAVWSQVYTVSFFSQMWAKRYQNSNYLGLLCTGPYRFHLHAHHFYYLFTTQSQLLTTLYKKPFENIMGKGENLHFLLFPQCFSSLQNKFHFFSHIYIVVCKCFKFGPV